MNESVTDEGRRQSILKLRPRLPLQEVPCFFPDDDTTTITRSRRVSFGRNLIKEFIVGSAASTKAFDEYEQSSESISEPSDCSGPLDLALNKSCANLELDSPCASHPESLTESGPVESDERVRLFTEGCIHLAKSVFDGGDGMTAAIIINAKPAANEEDRRNMSSVSYTNLDLSHFQDSSSGPGQLSPKSVSQLERVRREEPDFVPMRHQELFSSGGSAQFTQSRFDFLNSPAGGLSQRPCDPRNQSFSEGRQEPRKAFARLSQPAALWRSEEEENIPPPHHGIPTPRPPVAHQQVVEIAYEETVEFTKAGRAEQLSLLFDESMDETLPSMPRPSSQSDMEETMGRPFLGGGLPRQGSQSDMDGSISRRLVDSTSDMEQTFGRPSLRSKCSQSDMEETMGRPLMGRILSQGSQSDMEETMGRPLMGRILSQGSQSDMEETMGRPLMGRILSQGSQSDMEETMGRPLMGVISQEDSQSNLELTQGRPEIGGVTRIGSQSDMEVTVGCPLNNSRARTEELMSSFLDQSENCDPLSNFQRKDLSFLTAEDVDIVPKRDDFLSSLDEEDDNEGELGPAANVSIFNSSGVDVGSPKILSLKSSNLSHHEVSSKSIMEHSAEGSNISANFQSKQMLTPKSLPTLDEQSSPSYPLTPSSKNDDDFEMELTETATRRPSAYNHYDLAAENVNNLPTEVDSCRRSLVATRTSSSVNSEAEAMSDGPHVLSTAGEAPQQPTLNETEDDFEMELTETATRRPLANLTVDMDDLPTEMDNCQRSFVAAKTSVGSKSENLLGTPQISNTGDISGLAGLAAPNDFEMELTETVSLRQSTCNRADADKSITIEKVAWNNTRERSFASTRPSKIHETPSIHESESASSQSEIQSSASSGNFDLACPITAQEIEDDFEMELTETAPRSSLMRKCSDLSLDHDDDVCLSTKSFNRSIRSLRTSMPAEIPSEPQLDPLAIRESGIAICSLNKSSFSFPSEKETKEMELTNSSALRPSMYKDSAISMDAEENNGDEKVKDDEVLSDNHLTESIDQGQRLVGAQSVCEDSHPMVSTDDVNVKEASWTDQDEFKSKTQELEAEPNQCEISGFATDLQGELANREEPMKEVSFLVNNEMLTTSFLLDDDENKKPQVSVTESHVNSSLIPPEIHEATVTGDEPSKDDVVSCQIDETSTEVKTNNLSNIVTSLGTLNPELPAKEAEAINSSEEDPSNRDVENQVEEGQPGSTPDCSLKNIEMDEGSTIEHPLPVGNSSIALQRSFPNEEVPNIVEATVDEDIQQSSSARGLDEAEVEMCAKDVSMDPFSNNQGDEEALLTQQVEEISENRSIQRNSERMENVGNLKLSLSKPISTTDCDVLKLIAQQDDMVVSESAEDENSFKEIQNNPIAVDHDYSQVPHLQIGTSDSSHVFNALTQHSEEITTITASDNESSSNQLMNPSAQKEEDARIIPPGRLTYCVTSTPYVPNDQKDSESVQVDRRITYCVQTSSQLVEEKDQDVTIPQDRRITYCVPLKYVASEEKQGSLCGQASINTTSLEATIAGNKTFDVAPVNDRRVTYCVAKGQSDLFEVATPEKMNQTQATFTINNAGKRFLESPCVGERNLKMIRPSNSPMTQPNENIVAEERMDVDSDARTDSANGTFTEFLSRASEPCHDGVNSFLSLNDISLGSGTTPIRDSNVSSTSDRRSAARSLKLQSPAREEIPVSSTDLPERSMVALETSHTDLTDTLTHAADEDVSTTTHIEDSARIVEEVVVAEIDCQETLEVASVQKSVLMEKNLTEHCETDLTESAAKELVEEASTQEPQGHFVAEETLSELCGTETGESPSKEICASILLQEASMMSETADQHQTQGEETESTENALNDLTSSLKKRLSLSSHVGDYVRRTSSHGVNITNDCAPVPLPETDVSATSNVVRPSTPKKTSATASLENISSRTRSGYKRKEGSVQILFSGQKETVGAAFNIVEAVASKETPKRLPAAKRKKREKDQTDHQVHRELKEQQLEDGCCWKLLNFQECIPGRAGHFNIRFPIMSGELQLFVSVTMKMDKCVVGEVRLDRINPPGGFGRFQKKHGPAFSFACQTLSSYITQEMVKMKNLEELPWYLDFFNSFACRITAIAEEVVAALEGCGGAKLADHIFSFRLLSMPLLINCTVDIDLLQVAQLGQPSLKFSHTMGHLNERGISQLVPNLWNGATPLLCFIKGTYKHLFSLESKHSGKVTRRAPLLF